jgi:hypothetical protein
LGVFPPLFHVHASPHGTVLGARMTRALVDRARPPPGSSAPFTTACSSDECSARGSSVLATCQLLGRLTSMGVAENHPSMATRGHLPATDNARTGHRSASNPPVFRILTMTCRTISPFSTLGQPSPQLTRFRCHAHRTIWCHAHRTAGPPPRHPHPLPESPGNSVRPIDGLPARPYLRPSKRFDATHRNASTEPGTTAAWRTPTPVRLSWRQGC